MSLTGTTGLKDTTVKMAWGSVANLAINKLCIKNVQIFYKNMHHAFEGIMYLCCSEGILETESYYHLQPLVITNLTNTQEWCNWTQSLFWHPTVTQERWYIYIYVNHNTLNGLLTFSRRDLNPPCSATVPRFLERSFNF